MMLDKFLKMSILFDFYGALLTDKQKQCLEMHFSADLSLSEIADQLGVSRQAVYDLLHRSEQLLGEYESKLKLVERHHDEQKRLVAMLNELETLSAAHGLAGDWHMRRTLQELRQLIDNAKEAQNDF